MDEKPFAQQRAAKVQSQQAKQKSITSSGEKARPNQKRADGSPSGPPKFNEVEPKKPSAIALLSAVDQDGQHQMGSLGTKQRTNSTILTTTTATNTLGKSSKDKLQRKRSTDQKRSQDTALRLEKQIKGQSD